MSDAAKSEFGKKMLEVQRTIGSVKKGCDNPYFNSKYASLADVLAVAIPALNAQGLRLSAPTGVDQYGMYVAVTIQDESGTGNMSRVSLMGKLDNMQDVGKAITYATRFGIVSLLALPQEDDDGESLSGRGPHTPTSYRPSTGTKSPPKPLVLANVGTITSEAKAESPVIQTGATELPFDRPLILKTAQRYCKVAEDQKKKTRDEIASMVQSVDSGCKKVSDLTDSGLRMFLSNIQEVVNG